MPLGLTFPTVRIIGSRVYGSTEKSSIAPLLGTHAELDAAAFEGRSCRTCGADKPIPVADHDLGVGAYVYEKRELIGQIYSRTHHPGDDVPTDEAGNGRNDQGGRMVSQVDPQIDGPYGRINSGRRHVGG